VVLRKRIRAEYDSEDGYSIEGPADLVGDFTNTGNITGDDENGVFVQGNMSGDFANSGTIEGGDYGVLIGVSEGVSFGEYYATVQSGDLTGDLPIAARLKVISTPA